MAADGFDALVEGLVAEHRRHVEALASENERLRSELMELCSGALSGVGERSTSRRSEPSTHLQVLVGDSPVNDDGDGSPRREGGLRRGGGCDSTEGRSPARVRMAKRPEFGDSSSPVARMELSSPNSVEEGFLSPGERRCASANSSDPMPKVLRRRQGSAMTLGSASALFRSTSDGCSGLPPKWPEWRGVDTEESDPGFHSTAPPRGHDRVFSLGGKAKSGGRLVDEASCCNRFVLHPGSTTRTLWDLFSSLIIGYDLVFIPFDLGGFPVSEAAPFFEVTDKCTACFWAWDLVMSFITGYHTGGLVEMRVEKIAIKYTRTWFALDLVVVVMDWIFIFLRGVTMLRIGKSRRLLRIIRTVRIVRSVKMVVKLAQMLDSFRSEGLRILLNIVALALCVLTINHYFACGWYYVGTASDPANNWILKNVDQEPIYLQYVTALHWSFTQFTPAGMEIHPSNFAERLYTVVTVFFAMITFSSFMGSITANMTALRRLSSEPATQQKILHDYFTEHGISAELGTRIWGYLKKNHFEHKKKALRKDIAVLKILPPSISGDLNEELYVPTIKQVPFFFHYGLLHYHGIRAICDGVVSEARLTLGERLFHAGTCAETMYFVTIGKMLYEHRDPRLSAVVEKCHWVTEPCLWMKWYYCGTLEAETSCQVLGIDSKKLRAVIAEQARARTYVRNYVSGFRAWMLSGDANEAGTWKTDIWQHTGQLKAIALEAMPEPECAEVESRTSWPRSGSNIGRC